MANHILFLVSEIEKLEKEKEKNKKAGPKPLTILEYQEKNRKIIQPPPIPKVAYKKKRSGKQYKKRREIAILYKKLNLTQSTEERKEIKNQITMIKKNK